MTVEIRELIIRARVVNGSRSDETTTVADDEVQAAIVADCVEQVLKILERRRER